MTYKEPLFWSEFINNLDLETTDTNEELDNEKTEDENENE